MYLSGEPQRMARVAVRVLIWVYYFQTLNAFWILSRLCDGDSTAQLQGQSTGQMML